MYGTCMLEVSLVLKVIYCGITLTVELQSQILSGSKTANRVRCGSVCPDVSNIREERGGGEMGLGALIHRARYILHVYTIRC